MNRHDNPPAADPTVEPPEALAPEDMTPETVDLARYYPPRDLFAMPLDALEELWQSTPDRGFYETALEQAVAAYVGDGSPDESPDLTRLEVIKRCLDLYADTPPQVPATTLPDGEVAWFKVPGRILRHLEEGQPLEAPPRTESGPTLKPGRVALIAAAVLAVGCMAVALIRGATTGQPGEADLTATAEAGAALAARPGETPTPTPLALENIDRPIRAGDDLRDTYPVLLEVSPSSGPARVFPVQQKAIRVAEWLYDADPDVANSVLGLVVRPVLGILYTPDNAVFLEALEAGDAITLRMSTGRTLRYGISHAERVDRQEVAIFEQRSPGIAIVLLGDPAGDRLVVHGRYLPAQETDGDETTALPGIETGQPGTDAVTGTTLTVTGASGVAEGGGAALADGWTYLLVDLTVRPAADLAADELVFQLVDPLGGRYAPVTTGGSPGAYPPLGHQSLAADAETQASLVFLVPAGTADPVLLARVGEGETLRYQLDYQPDSGLTAGDLAVLVVESATTGSAEQPGDLLLSVRFYNPHARAISLGPEDLAVVYSPVSTGDTFPVGPQALPGDLAPPLTIQPGGALDLDLRFDWTGESYAGVTLAGHRYLTQLR